MEIQVGDTLTLEIALDRCIAVYVEEIDSNGTLWCLDSDGRDWEVPPNRHDRIMRVN